MFALHLVNSDAVVCVIAYIRSFNGLVCVEGKPGECLHRKTIVLLPIEFAENGHEASIHELRVLARL